MKEVYTTRRSDDDVEGFEIAECAIGKDDVLEKAIQWLVDRGLMKVLPDEFGPPIYTAAEDMGARVAGLTSADPTSPFAKFKMVSDGERWLRQALERVNETYDQLGVAPSDFDVADQEWEPLRLDRNDPSLQRAIQSLDETIEQVRSDNGYNATIPEERDYVLTGLSDTSKRLKEAQSVSVPFLRAYALEPLNTLMWRFKDAAIGIIAAGAKQALIQFVKQHSAKLLQWLISG